MCPVLILTQVDVGILILTQVHVSVPCTRYIDTHTASMHSCFQSVAERAILAG